jgi:transcription elongation factor Elf1
MPANLPHPCPVCGHELAVMVTETPKGRLTQCANCGELDYCRHVRAAAPALPGRS